MTATIHDSVEARLSLGDSAGTTRDISANLISCVPQFGRVMSEATTAGATHERVHPGIALTTLEIEVMYNEDALTGSDTVLGPLLESTTARVYEFYPKGTGGKKYHGNCFVEAWNPSMRIGSLVIGTATLRGLSRTRA